MKSKLASLGFALSKDVQKKLVGVSCLCENGKSAEMASCDTCPSYCKDEWSSTQKVCD